MRFRYNLDPKSLINTIYEKTDNMPRLWKRIILLKKPDALWGSIRKGRVLLVKVSPGLRGVPRLYFKGKVFSKDERTAIVGFFYLPLHYIIALLILCFGVGVLYLNLTPGDKMVFADIYGLLIVYVGGVLLAFIFSIIAYYRDYQYIITFLKSLNISDNE